MRKMSMSGSGASKPATAANFGRVGQQPKSNGGSLGPSNSGDNSPFANFSIPRGGKGGTKGPGITAKSTVGRGGGGKGSTRGMATVRTSKGDAPVSAKARVNGRNQSK